ncbi:sulfurtransferase [Spongiimicrobium salis]|uniref:sulfurtransferase n=1 Tax=Spongiimicrobium salis TaxID=1667022 RepID=UPI00374CE5E8
MEKSGKYSNPFITAQELHGMLRESGVKVFDVRGTWGTNPRSLYGAYLEAHIPTAVFLDWRKEFIEQGVPPSLAQVSSKEEAQESFKNLGIEQGDTVILYDDDFHMFAGRIWWAMRYWGFENVRVLNGGLKHWKGQGYNTTASVPEVKPGSFEPKCQTFLRVSLDDFMIQREHAQVLDGRGIVGYQGKPEDPRSGHIPGAISAAYNVIVDKETGLFQGKEALQAFFDVIVPGWRTDDIIASCGAGYSGTVAMLALASLGVGSSLFDGSFSVWKQDPSRPVVQSYAS